MDDTTTTPVADRTLIAARRKGLDDDRLQLFERPKPDELDRDRDLDSTREPMIDRRQKPRTP